MNILKIPNNAGGLSKRDGVEKGPDAVEAHLNDFYLNEKGMMPLFEIENLDIDNSNLEECHAKIEKASLELTRKNDFSIIVGGDHSMTYASFRAFAKTNPGAGLIVLDAHPDVQEVQNPPTHEDYLRVLIDEGTLDAEKVILIGCRNMSMQESKFIEQNRIKNYSMREIGFEGMQEITDNAMSVAREWPCVYLSIDIDVLDPAFAPGTGYAEPGGLTTRELIYTVQRFKLLRNLKMADLVEVNPKKDRDDMTAKAAAKIIVELS